MRSITLTGFLSISVILTICADERELPLDLKYLLLNSTDHEAGFCLQELVLCVKVYASKTQKSTPIYERELPSYEAYTNQPPLKYREMCGERDDGTLKTFGSYCDMLYFNCIENRQVWSFSREGPCKNPVTDITSDYEDTESITQLPENQTNSATNANTLPIQTTTTANISPQ